MLRDRNLTAHLYAERLAKEIVTRVRAAYPELRRVYQELCARFLRR